MLDMFCINLVVIEDVIQLCCHNIINIRVKGVLDDIYKCGRMICATKIHEKPLKKFYS